jgi:hypothetical protein
MKIILIQKFKLKIKILILFKKNSTVKEIRIIVVVLLVQRKSKEIL